VTTTTTTTTARPIGRPPTRTLRQALRAVRQALAGARRGGERPEIALADLAEVPLAGQYEYLVVREAPAAGGGTLLGCYRWRRERQGVALSPWRAV